MRLDEILVMEGRNAVKDVPMHIIREGKGGGVKVKKTTKRGVEREEKDKGRDGRKRWEKEMGERSGRKN